MTVVQAHLGLPCVGDDLGRDSSGEIGCPSGDAWLVAVVQAASTRSLRAWRLPVLV
jgi:hypothetical protein